MWFYLIFVILASTPFSPIYAGRYDKLLKFCEKDSCALLIKFSKDASSIERHQAIYYAGVKTNTEFKRLKAAAVEIATTDQIDSLLSDPAVDAVIPDRPIKAFADQVVPAGVARIGAPPSWLVADGQGIGIAIVDTGLDMLNKDLNIGTTCFSAFGKCQDKRGHGTHVAGIAAARNNVIDVVGVAPNAVVYAVKVIDDLGRGTDASLIAGLNWIAANAESVSPPIRVVNMSLGRSGTLNDNPILRAAVKVLTDEKGLTLIVSAGNSYYKEVKQMVPAGYPEVISVASSTAIVGTSRCKKLLGGIKADTASYFTTDGAFDVSTNIGVSISAPGAEKENIGSTCRVSTYGILSLKIGGGTTRMSGTSMAAPHVAGAAALLIQSQGPLDPEAVRIILRSTASKIGTAPLNSPVTGYSFDGEREGVLSICDALGVSCP